MNARLALSLNLALCPNVRPLRLGSELIIGELLPAEGKCEKCWKCWLKHVQYLSILNQHVISREELVTLATLIEEHHAAFQKAHGAYAWNSAL